MTAFINIERIAGLTSFDDEKTFITVDGFTDSIVVEMNINVVSNEIIACHDQ